MQAEKYVLVQRFSSGEVLFFAGYTDEGDRVIWTDVVEDADSFPSFRAAKFESQFVKADVEIKRV